MKITPYSVVLGLPAPLRFAVVADMHARPAPGLPELILSEKPDALLMPGDIFDTRGSREDALTFLGAMAAKLPVFCSFGNHDRHMKDDDRAELDRIGVRVLDNTAVTFRGLTIGGLTSGFFTEYRTGPRVACGVRRHAVAAPASLSPSGILPRVYQRHRDRAHSRRSCARRAVEFLRPRRFCAGTGAFSEIHRRRIRRRQAYRQPRRNEYGEGTALFQSDRNCHNKHKMRSDITPHFFRAAYNLCASRPRHRALFRES